MSNSAKTLRLLAPKDLAEFVTGPVRKSAMRHSFTISLPAIFVSVLGIGGCRPFVCPRRRLLAGSDSFIT